MKYGRKHELLINCLKSRDTLVCVLAEGRISYQLALGQKALHSLDPNMKVIQVTLTIKNKLVVITVGTGCTCPTLSYLTLSLQIQGLQKDQRLLSKKRNFCEVGI